MANAEGAEVSTQTVGRPKTVWTGWVSSVNSVVARRGYVDFDITLDHDANRRVVVSIRTLKLDAFIEKLRNAVENAPIDGI